MALSRESKELRSCLKSFHMHLRGWQHKQSFGSSYSAIAALTESVDLSSMEGQRWGG